MWTRRQAYSALVLSLREESGKTWKRYTAEDNLSGNPYPKTVLVMEAPSLGNSHDVIHQLTHSFLTAIYVMPQC